MIEKKVRWTAAQAVSVSTTRGNFVPRLEIAVVPLKQSENDISFQYVFFFSMNRKNRTSHIKHLSDWIPSVKSGNRTTIRFSRNFLHYYIAQRMKQKRYFNCAFRFGSPES